MRVYKFGGASIKDAEGVRNLKKILKEEPDHSLVVVISAMGKMTNALEKVVLAAIDSKKEWHKPLQLVKDFHSVMLAELFPDSMHPIYAEIAKLYSKIEYFLKNNKSEQHAFVYDQVVCYGELLSTTIVSMYLNDNGVKNNWLDARNCIITDAKYRDATVDWEASSEVIQSK